MNKLSGSLVSFTIPFHLIAPITSRLENPAAFPVEKIFAAGLALLYHRYTQEEWVTVQCQRATQEIDPLCFHFDEADDWPALVRQIKHPELPPVMPECLLAVSQKPIVPNEAPPLPEGLSLVIHEQSSCDFEAQMMNQLPVLRFVSAEKISGHLLALLEGIDPAKNNLLWDIPLITPGERHLIFEEWNQPFAADWPSACLHELIQEQARQAPSAIAVREGTRTLTYAELDQRAGLAATLLPPAQPGERLALFLGRSLDLAVVFLTAWKAGYTCVPIDPSLPAQRVEWILFNAGVSRILTNDRHRASLPVSHLPVHLFEEGNWKTQSASPQPAIDPRQACLILFTSGSTGLPKGVVHTHHNFTSRLASACRLNPIGPGDAFAQTSPLSSIDALDEFLLPLTTGARLEIISDDTVKSPQRLVEALSTQEITHILLVPSLLRLLLDHGRDLSTRLSRLTHWIIGGEPLTQELVDRFYAAFPDSTLGNFYGLTEGDATYFDTHLPHPYSAQPPIGLPIPNAQVYILDRHLSPAPMGVIGEICVSSSGIAAGYLNAEGDSPRFVNNPFYPEYRLFRTGDLGRWLPDGLIEYMGRKDRQVKIRGYRVDLAEIESVLRQHPAVKEVVASVRRMASTSENQLVAYFVRQPGSAQNADELRNLARQKLPEFAVPSYFMELAELPLNANGKVDVPRLPEPSAGVENRKTLIAPRDGLESQLVRLWEEMFHIHPISITDDFWELGGDSFLAIRFLAEVEHRYKKDLPISVFFQATTIADFSTLLRQQGLEFPWSSLVPIQPNGERIPFFCVHADGGALIYRSLAKHLGADQPFYGLQARGLDGKSRPLEHVEDMAREYLQEIRTVQAHGPYRLGAFSLGGVVIYEMAKQLLAAGESVELLAFFDAYGPDYPQFTAGNSQVQYKISVHRNALNSYNFWGKIGYLWRRTKSRLRLTFLPTLGTWMQSLGLPLPHSIRYQVVRKVLNQAADRYKPAGYPGDITLFRAQQQPDDCVPDPCLGWRPYVSGDIRIIDVSGNHNTLMKEPLIQDLALKLKDCL